jgi:predicted N-formylglutamate amidohydrolase
MKKTFEIILCCPHGGARAPAPHRTLFAGGRGVLSSHRGSDIGALALARALALRLQTPLIFTDVSRLIVDCNRGPRHPELFSEFTRTLGPAQKQRILEQFYTPYRTSVERAVTRAARARRTALHLTIHSFTPVFNGQQRNADVGLLYDYRRSAEKAFALQFIHAAATFNPNLRVRRNYPYRGDTVSHPTQLRKQYSADQYIGIEIEVNNKLLAGTGTAPRHAMLGNILSAIIF